MTKSIKHIIKAGPVCCGIIAAMALASCSDWDDHYAAETDVLPSQQSSLWQNIDAQGDLHQFATLLKKVGYDQVVNSPQAYTVWAPKDNTYDYESLLGTSDSVLVRNFVMNHIAQTNHQVSGQIDQQRIFMLNKKMMLLNGNGNYTLQGIAMNPAIASSNGTLYTLEGKIPYLQNIYESLSDKSLSLDSIHDYFQAYETRELDKKQSVQGPSKNGEITYLEAIYYEDNALYDLFKADISLEDSSYTMLLPTNDAWHKARTAIASYFNYVPQFKVTQNSTGSADGTTVVTTVSLTDPEQLKDSMVNYLLAHDLIYSNNIYDNGRLKTLQTGEALQCDSLMSTLQTKIYSEDAQALFTDATRYNRSNGAVWVTDSLHIHPWTSWNPEIKVEAENGKWLFKTEMATSQVQTVTHGSQNPEVSGKLSGEGYLEALPLLDGSHPDLYFYLPGIRSTEYNIYLVMVPANITNRQAQPKVYEMSIDMGYADATGSHKTKSVVTSLTNESNYLNIDTLFAGSFTFPIAYEGTGEYYPYLRLRSRYKSAVKDQRDDNLRIDCIILRPKELDDYLKLHPDYKYDTERNNASLN